MVNLLSFPMKELSHVCFWDLETRHVLAEGIGVSFALHLHRECRVGSACALPPFWPSLGDLCSGLTVAERGVCPVAPRWAWRGGGCLLVSGPSQGAQVLLHGLGPLVSRRRALQFPGAPHPDSGAQLWLRTKRTQFLPAHVEPLLCAGGRVAACPPVEGTCLLCGFERGESHF